LSDEKDSFDSDFGKSIEEEENENSEDRNKRLRKEEAEEVDEEKLLKQEEKREINKKKVKFHASLNKQEGANKKTIKAASK
jgi:hypothetical protein